MPDKAWRRMVLCTVTVRSSSLHGDRVDDSGRATIETLPEIVEMVGARMPVLVDSGFRRGTDIVKALAMGAQAVCIGRPYL
jgi:4-hydroxymandelate oxidase